MSIIVDDKVPCIQKSNQFQPIFCSVADEESKLIAIVEKAWAKINDGYDKIENNFSVNALRDLTGAPVFEYSLKDDGVEEQIIDGLYQKYILTAHLSKEEGT